MMRKNIFLFFLVLILSFTFAACGNKENNYIEPDIGEENYTWLDSVPFAQFGKPADKIDYIDVSELTMSNDLRMMVSSLKSVINGKEVRLYTRDLSSTPDWLGILNYKTDNPETNRVTVYSDPWDLIEKYKDELTGVVIYDTAVMETLDLACTYAGIHNCLTVTFNIYTQLVSKGYNFEILEDYREKFTDKFEAYEYLYNNLWQKCTHKLIISEHTSVVGFLRSFGMLVNAGFVYLDVTQNKDYVLMEKFLKDMPDGESAVFGWYPNESNGVKQASLNGVMTYAADFLENLEFFAHAVDDIKAPDYTEKEYSVKNKVYVALAFSEGDNLSYDSSTIYRSLLTDSHFGTFPVTLTVSPAAGVLLPEILNYYYSRSNDFIGYMTGPSGLGYTYVSDWADNLDGLKKFMKNTNRYCELSHIKVVNNWYSGNWNKTTPDNILSMMGEHYTSLLGVIDQSPIKVQNSNGLLLTRMDVPYTYDTSTQTNLFKMEIESAVSELEWFSDSPIFLYLQGNPWTDNGMSDYYNLYTYIMQNYAEKVEFVRMDEIVMLQRMHLNMSAER